MNQFILAIDQGTTSSRAVIFNHEGVPQAYHQIEFKQYFPQEAWVEHDPEEIWRTTLECCRAAMKKLSLEAKDIAAIGISNQRETTIVWDRVTGKSIYPAIVWQDRRTADFCHELVETVGIRGKIAKKTGLLLDPYFSATKIAWILNHVDGARERAARGELAFGTIDTFLLWRLTQGKRHATDASNASRTLLFNINSQEWDQELLELFHIPLSLLPDVCDNCADFGTAEKEWFGGEIPISGMAGDQQAATVGQACFSPGMVKSTYGTGGFVFLNTGDQVVTSQNRLLSTVAYRLDGKVTYGLEGSIFIAGAAVQWLRDAIHLVKQASETEAMAVNTHDNGGVYFVPAFTGLGAPYWDPKARGALLGLTRDSNANHIARATLEAVCYQTRDLMQAMVDDFAGELATLRVDGGMVANNWLLQFLTDILDVPVERPKCIETSALGAAFLAGLGVGIYHSLDDITALWKPDKHFSPMMGSEQRELLVQGWKHAVERVLGQPFRTNE